MKWQRYVHHGAQDQVGLQEALGMVNLTVTALVEREKLGLGEK